MSLSPLPKKGSFSNLFTSQTSHKRAPSHKALKTSPVRPVHPTPEPPKQPTSPKSSLTSLKSELLKLQQKNSKLKQKIQTLKTQATKTDLQTNATEKKALIEIQAKCLHLIDSLFHCIDNIFCLTVNRVKQEDLELKLIEDFQDFQRKTQINTSAYIRKVLGWRHQFNDELLSPADSIKGEKVNKKGGRSVSSIIASSIKVYAICLKDFCVNGQCEDWFRKGEIVELVQIGNKTCEGRIGDREGVFPKEFVKIV